MWEHAVSAWSRHLIWGLHWRAVVTWPRWALGNGVETKQESTKQLCYVFEHASDQSTFLYFSSHMTCSFSMIDLTNILPAHTCSPKVSHILPSLNGLRRWLKHHAIELKVVNFLFSVQCCFRKWKDMKGVSTQRPLTPSVCKKPMNLHGHTALTVKNANKYE